MGVLGHGSICVLASHDVAGYYCGLDRIVFVHVLEEDCLADWGFVVDSLAAVPVPAGPNFVEEGTVYLVHLGTIDLR